MTNDTLAIQAALDAATASRFPPVHMSLQSRQQNPFGGSPVRRRNQWTGTAGGESGFQSSAPVPNVTPISLIQRWRRSEQPCKEFGWLVANEHRYQDPTITNVVIGVAIMPLPARFEGTIAGITLSRIVGNATGQGYNSS